MPEETNPKSKMTGGFKESGDPTNKGGFTTKPEKYESIQHFIDYTWKDIHHSRTQNWTSLTVIAGIHIGLYYIGNYFQWENLSHILITILFFNAILSCIIGFIITINHQSKFYDQIKWIIYAEEELKTLRFLMPRNDEGIITGDLNKFSLELIQKMKRKKYVSTGYLMGYLYLLVMIIDLSLLFNFLFCN